MIIGLHAAKGAGKDYAFLAIKHAFPYLNIGKIAFADPIKNEVCKIFDLATEEQYDLFKRSSVQYQLPGHLTHSVEGRHIVRSIGMAMRDIDENQFTRYVAGQINSGPTGKVWCITDVRFANEVSLVRQLGGKIVKVVRPGVAYDGHVTETELPDDACDAIIINDGTPKFSDLIVNEVSKWIDTTAPQQ